MADMPILYSFRRCPYAMRARLAVGSSGQQVELREIVLKDKAKEFLEASPKGTVPVLVDVDDFVIEESLDVIQWALNKNDPEDFLDYSDAELEVMRVLIEEADGPFKHALDRYKYENRYDGVVAEKQRDAAKPFLMVLNDLLEGQDYLFGDRFSWADCAILPFVRQYAHVDKDWFWAQDWPDLIGWLDRFLVSERFLGIMNKYPKWNAGDEVTLFP